VDQLGVGYHSGKTGSYTLSNSKTITVNNSLLIGQEGAGTFNMTGGALTLAKGTDHVIKLGGTSTGTGTWNLDNTSGLVTISETGSGNGVNLIVRDNDDATGTLNGYGTVGLTGTLTNNGQINANGYGDNRTLDLSSFASVTNGDLTDDGTNGWFAVDHGKLTLPPIPVSAVNNTCNWGEYSTDEAIDLINSMRMTFNSVTTSGNFSASLLAADHGDVPGSLPNNWSFMSVWDFILDDLEFTNMNLVVRYDDTHENMTEEITVLLMRYNPNSNHPYTKWEPVSGYKDLTNNWITRNNLPFAQSTEFFAVVQPLGGDANMDGTVGLQDLSLFALSYGQTSGQTWETCDFNGDGAVNLQDMSILSTHYGEGGGEDGMEGYDELLNFMEEVGYFE